ncbi:unnamed protein product [Clonostachys byssicola]|uniref:Uncharacterized protein n=1 Tax=Clonostachys byssicola TaxID=160290 RepID=A0A9N9UA93_9HYPO|nr:unnamed protein product [Clonostachys byssicola]
MDCICAKEHVFVGLDFGTTLVKAFIHWHASDMLTQSYNTSRSGSYATLARVCREHGLFRVIKRAWVSKFPTKFKLSDDNRIEMVAPDQEVPEGYLVQHAKLEILFSDLSRFEKTDDFNEIQSWVKEGWRKGARAGYVAEHFGVAVKTLFELVLDQLKEPHIPRESITIVVAFPVLTDKIKDLLKMGLNYSNISSYCQDVHIGLESHAALASLLSIRPESAQVALTRHESIIVADCGGITLDISAFRSSSTNKTEVVYTSILGGGIWIDYNFEKLLDERLDALKPDIMISEPDDGEVESFRSWLVFLTGGLGRSPAVRELVQRILDTKVKRGERAMRIDSTTDLGCMWNAVARGATHYFDPNIPVTSPTWQPFAKA